MKHVRKITGTNPLGHSKWTLTTHNSTALRREFEISHLNKEQRDALFRCFCCCRLNKRPFENLNIFQVFWIRFDASFPLHYSRRRSHTLIIPNQFFSQIKNSATQRFSVVWASFFGQHGGTKAVPIREHRTSAEIRIFRYGACKHI